ncbi:MAG: hypothetical protein KZQ66_04495 [Candidatus Thiodiazotropha sp. (ex Lucinoma aequizonata)]|nr:hypothetical protein [Candidatus Thiodiazotropha sp. (ex Lucinoma aequizonata)]MCU7901344.1 hypothetical protein [Candidatus Thiodiazotropha sp. (ex Lucinoma aequizonata)]
MTELSDTHQLSIQLAYYPPYHSKYDPVDRLLGCTGEPLAGGGDPQFHQ